MYGMLERGISHRKIAEKLGRSQSSISREIKNNTKYGKNYLPCHAQARAKRIGDRQRYKAPLKNPETFLFVREHLRKPFSWSPETIAGTLKKQKLANTISTEAIYQHIYNPKYKKSNLSKYLVRNHEKRKKQTGRSVHKTSKIPFAISIDNRPKYIANRKQLGHWESDLMEGPRSSKPVLCVTTERSTRYTIISKLNNKKTKAKTINLVKRMSKLPAHMRRSLTVDNGSENTNHQYLTCKLNIKIFFCHPYHSWEKGTIENTIGRIRRYIPKGTDLTPFSTEKIRQLEYILNSTPRKCLGYATPYEMMDSNLKKLSKLT